MSGAFASNMVAHVTPLAPGTGTSGVLGRNPMNGESR